jgi:hypothetical protein
MRPRTYYITKPARFGPGNHDPSDLRIEHAGQHAPQTSATPFRSLPKEGAENPSEVGLKSPTEARRGGFDNE